MLKNFTYGLIPLLFVSSLNSCISVNTSQNNNQAATVSQNQTAQPASTNTPKPGESSSPATSVSPTAVASSAQASATPTATASVKPATTTDLQKAIADFKTEFETEGKTPQGSIKMLFKALLKIEEDSNLAENILTVVLKTSQMYEDQSKPSGYDVGSSMRFLFGQMKADPNIVRSYVGATPEEKYQNFDKNNIVINYPSVSTIPEGKDEGRIYIKSSGKSGETPISLNKDATSGLWKINTSSVSNIATGLQ